jgi:hypothetical protein
MHTLPLDLEESDFLNTRTNGLMLHTPSPAKSPPWPTKTASLTSNTKTKPKNRVTFLQLPLEIRLEIYNLVLGSRSPIQRPYDFDGKGRISLGLLQVSRQIYWETRLIPFQINIFDFEKWTGTGIYYCQLFIQKLSLWQIREVRHITLSVVELNMTRDQTEGGWIMLCRALGGQEQRDCRLKSLRLSVGGSLLSHGRHLLDVKASWVTEGLVHLKGLQLLEMVIASDGVEKGLVKTFSEDLEQVLQKTKVIVQTADKGLMCTII